MYEIVTVKYIFAEFASCKEAYENGFTTSGVYKLTGMGYHYCVMTSLGKCSGAGWTLIMKTKGGLVGRR